MTALTGAYHRLRQVDAAFALWALLLTSVSTLGMAIHGGYDLANIFNPPASANLGLPSQIDPRGLLTFGVMGIALFVIAWLMGRSEQFPKSLAYLGYLLAVLLMVIYLARLIILDPANPVLLVPVAGSRFCWSIRVGIFGWG